MNRASGFLLFLIALSSGLNADDRGYEIAKRSDSLKEPATRSMVGVMQIRDASGAQRMREMRMYIKKTEGGEYSSMEILKPADVAGTKFLSIPLEGGETDQRLYLPALKKIRKIASGGKSGDFVNSDFSYYDLEDHAFEDFTYTFLSEGDAIPDPIFAGKKFYRLESRSKKNNAPYVKVVAWIDMESYFTYRLETFDKADGGLWKVFTITKTETIKGMLVETETVVENRKRGSSTVLRASEVKIDGALPKDIFSVKSLEG